MEIWFEANALVGIRRALGDPPSAATGLTFPQAQSPQSLALTSQPGGYLLAWGGSTLKALTLDALGVPTNPVAISIHGEFASTLSAVWDGTQYVVAWLNSSAGQTAIHARRVSESGTVLDPEGARVPIPPVPDKLRTASDGNASLVVWSGASASAALLSQAGAFAPSFQLPLASADAVVWDGRHYVVFSVNAHSGRAVRVSASGELVDQTALEVFEDDGLWHFAGTALSQGCARSLLGLQVMNAYGSRRQVVTRRFAYDQPDQAPCTSGAQCVSGVCEGGVCIGGPPATDDCLCLSAPPAGGAGGAGGSSDDNGGAGELGAGRAGGGHGGTGGTLAGGAGGDDDSKTSAGAGAGAAAGGVPAAGGADGDSNSSAGASAKAGDNAGGDSSVVGVSAGCGCEGAGKSHGGARDGFLLLALAAWGIRRRRSGRSLGAAD